MLINLTHKPSKQRQEKNLDKFSYNLDYALGQCNPAHVLFGFNLNCLKKIEKNKLQSNITSYGLQIFDVH